MKNVMKRWIVVLLTGLMILSIVACANAKKDKVIATKDITLNLYESYTDAAWGVAEVIPDDCSSENEEVAYVGFNGRIEGASAGTTVVKVNLDAGTYVYNVTVKDVEDRSAFRPGTSVKMYNLYLGAGYNAFDAELLPTASDLNVITPIINASDIDEYLSLNPSFLMYDSNGELRLLELHTNSTEEAAKSYTDEISGGLKLALSDIGDISANGKYSKIKKNQTASKVVMSSVVRHQTMYTCWINANPTKVRALAKKNTDFWEDLTDKNVDPLDLFETYGTHVVLGVEFGGRIAIDYQLISESDSTDNQTMMNIAGNLNLKISSVSASVNGSYIKDESEKMSASNISSSFKASVVGGPVTNIVSFESYGENFNDWLTRLKNDDYTWAVIGIRQDGLVPIWQLLPKSEKERADQIKQAYEQKAAELRNAQK